MIPDDEAVGGSSKCFTCVVAVHWELDNGHSSVPSGTVGLVTRGGGVEGAWFGRGEGEDDIRV